MGFVNRGCLTDKILGASIVSLVDALDCPVEVLLDDLGQAQQRLLVVRRKRQDLQVAKIGIVINRGG